MSSGTPSLYRRLGADPPFGDPRRFHGVAMEGYYWRFTDAASGRVVIALIGVCRDRDGTWATIAIATDPGRVLHSAIVSPALADSARLGVDAGDGAFVASAERLSVRIGEHARLEVRLSDGLPWPRRAFGGLGPAHWVPALGQYWHPHLLSARADGELVLGGERLVLDGARAYAEKNWGNAFPREWWWGEAHDFGGEDVTVAFAGGSLGGPVVATALVVRLGGTVIRLSAPSALVSARADPRHWRVQARSARYRVELEAAASGEPCTLPVPLPAERRNVFTAHQQLAARMSLRIRRGPRVLFEGTTEQAGLEYGG